MFSAQHQTWSNHLKKRGGRLGPCQRSGCYNGNRISPTSSSGLILNTENKCYSWACPTRKTPESPAAVEICCIKAVHYLVNMQNSSLASPLVLMKSHLCFPMPGSAQVQCWFPSQQQAAGSHSTHHVQRLSASPSPAVWDIEQIHLFPGLQRSSMLRALCISQLRLLETVVLHFLSLPQDPSQLPSFPEL